MFVLFNFVLLLTVFKLNNVLDCEGVRLVPKTRLPHGGILVGSYIDTANGNQIRAFRGIPYAKPPVGHLRFRVRRLQLLIFLSNICG